MSDPIPSASGAGAAPASAHPSDRPFTTGWRVAIVIAVLGALGGGASARRDARAAQSGANRAQHDAARLRNEVQGLQRDIKKLERELAELREKPR